MTRIHFAHLFGVLANVGVILGILLLAFELNQNRQMMRAQTRDSIANSGSALQLSIAANSELSEILERVRNGEPVSELEMRRWQAVWTALFRNWENQYYQYSIGLYDEDEYVGIREAFRAAMRNNDAAREYFCSSRNVRSERFVEEIMGLMDEERC